MFSLDKSMESAISLYMIFLKESSNDVTISQSQSGKSKEELDLSNFLNLYQDMFIDIILGELYPKEGMMTTTKKSEFFFYKRFNT